MALQPTKHKMLAHVFDSVILSIYCAKVCFVCCWECFVSYVGAWACLRMSDRDN